jgi:hypothetical protein
MSQINPAHSSIVFEEIGETGALEVSILQKWLNLPKDPTPSWHKELRAQVTSKGLQQTVRGWETRFAPSIVCRSEAELFAVSMPRFALRVRLPNSSFANLRRLGSLCGQLEAWLIHSRWRWIHSLYALIAGEPSRVLANARCVADAFLLPPSRISDHFITISAPLAKAYGECEANHPETNGTIYARHIKAGGGMCAQASCLMAAALLPQYAKAVHGVAEITALARDRLVENTRISLSGLYPSEMQRYFRRAEVGLDALGQAPIIGADIESVDKNIRPCKSVIAFRHALEIGNAGAASGGCRSDGWLGTSWRT